MDEFDELIDKGSQAVGDEFDDLIAKGAAKVPNVQAPSWYDSIVEPIKHMFTPLTDEEWKAKVEATKQPGQQMTEEVGRITSDPIEFAKFAGRSALGLGGQYAGGALGFSPAAAAATPLARTGIGAAAGGIQAGTDALAHGAGLGEAAGDTIHGAIFGGGLDAAHAVAGALGGATKGSANRKLAERSLSSAELNDVRAEGGGKAVQQTGQELRDLGVTKPRSLLDFFTGNSPQRMSENSLDILNNARTELDRSTKAITGAPARDVAQYTSEYAPDAVTVGQAPVDVSPINKKLHGQADALDYAKNPDKAQTYRNLAEELTTPAKPQAPRPNASYEPVAESRVPETPDAPVSQLPLESRMPEQPADPAALSSEPTGPIEHNAPPMSSAPTDNLLDLPPPTGPGEIDTTSHLAKPYQASTPEVSTQPILDLEPTGRIRNPAMEAGAGDANMSPSPFEDLMSNAPEPRPYPGRPDALPVPANEDLLNQVGSQLRDVPVTPGGESMPIGGHHQRRMDRLQSGVPDLNANAPGVHADLNLLSGLGEQMDMLPSQKWGAGKPVSIHDAPPVYPQGTEPVDTSYWPHPYEMSRNEPPMPSPEAGLPPAKQTVLEPTPRFKGDSPAPGLSLDQPRQDFQPDNLLAPTALYPDNPPLPQGEMAPLGMSRRAPIVGPITHTGTAQGPRPPVSNLDTGPLEQSRFDGPTHSRISLENWQSLHPHAFYPDTPHGRGFETGRFPETPRPTPPADPSTGFTMEQLMSMRRELGNQTRNFTGRPLNKTEGDMSAATRDAWKGAGDALTGSLAGHVEAGNLTPDVVDSYRDANKTFSTIADVNKNLATRTNQDFKTPSSSGDETVLGAGFKATERAKERMLGLNAQYRIGQGIEGVGNAAQAGSDLARMGAGLGWNSNREEHPEIAKAQAENPQAPKAQVEQKANDDMKSQLQKAWYNVKSWIND